MVEAKLGLAATFVGVFFVACWISLWVVDRIAPAALLVSPELELVRRYQQIVGRHTFALRTVVSLILALLLGSVDERPMAALAAVPQRAESSES